MKKLGTLTCSAVLGSTMLMPLFADTPTKPEGAAAAAISGPAAGQAIRHDLSRPMWEIAAQPLKGRARPPAEINTKNAEPGRPRPVEKDQPAAPDLKRQTESALPEAKVVTGPPLLTFSGLSDDDNAAVLGTRIVPPDTNGDIGPNHYVQYINLIWAVWDISRDIDGNPTSAALALGPLPGNVFWVGFGGPCETNNDGDPIVLYDELADRWLVSQFSPGEGTQCVAVSQTPNPTGAYYRYAFAVTPGGFNDYPKFGVMPNAYYATFRDFGGTGGSFSNSAAAFDRAKMLVGDPSASFVKFSLPCTATDCVEGLLPSHLEGASPAPGAPGIFVAAVDEAFDDSPHGIDGYRLFELAPDFVTPANSTFVELPFVAAGSSFDRFLGNGFSDCISPVAGGEVLDCLAAFTMYKEQYRSFPGYDSILLNTTVDAGGETAGIRWAELRNDGSGWTLFQDGTYAPADGEERWMGSIAMDSQGNIALGYSLTSGSRFPSIAYNTRVAADTPGTLPGGEVIMTAGTGAQTASANRWGDYSSMSVDPVADCTFWFTSEYYETTGSFDFNTSIGAFQIAECGPGEEDVDSDGDGVLDGADACPTTDWPDAYPTTGVLGRGRYTLQSPPDFSKNEGRVSVPSYSLADTNGCSCDDLVDGGFAVGSLSSNKRRGCTQGTMDNAPSVVGD